MIWLNGYYGYTFSLFKNGVWPEYFGICLLNLRFDVSWLRSNNEMMAKSWKKKVLEIHTQLPLCGMPKFNGAKNVSFCILNNHICHSTCHTIVVLHCCVVFIFSSIYKGKNSQRQIFYAIHDDSIQFLFRYTYFQRI